MESHVKSTYTGSQIDWDSIFNDKNIDNVWSKFKRSLINVVNISIPYRKRKPWRLKANPKIRTALRHVRRCYSFYKLQKTDESLLKFIQVIASLQNHIARQVSYFEKHIVQTLRENPRRYWSYVNSKLQSKGNHINIIKTGDETIEEPLKIAEALNEHFLIALIIILV